MPGSSSVSPRKATSTSPRWLSAASEKSGPAACEPQRRIGKAEIEAFIAARHRRARRQHDAATAVGQFDQFVELAAAGEALDRAGDFKPTAGAVFAMGG